MGRRITVNIKGMTREERNAYSRAAMARRRVGVAKRQVTNLKEMTLEERRAYNAFARMKTHSRKKGSHPLMVQSWQEYMMLTSGKSCEICGSAYKVVADHCHISGKFRGALCNLCNRGIGFFEDRPDLLEQAAAYLRRTGLHA